MLAYHFSLYGMLKKCYTELFYNVCVTYYTDLLYVLLKGIIFNLIACSENRNRIPVQLSTYAQVTEKHDGPKTVLKVSYSRQMFLPAVEKKNSLRLFKYQHLFSVHLNMRLCLCLY